MKLKKGDNVKMLSGKDRGKTGKVIEVIPREGRVKVEGLQIVRKHIRPRKQGEKGQIASVPARIPMSKVMLVCPKCAKATRVGYRYNNDTKTRVCKKCGSEI